jgi:hypothetical protein
MLCQRGRKKYSRHAEFRQRAFSKDEMWNSDHLHENGKLDVEAGTDPSVRVEGSSGMAG